MQEQNIAQMLENPFMQYNHIEIVSVTSDSAVMSLDIRRVVADAANGAPGVTGEAAPSAKVKSAEKSSGKE